MGYQVRGSWGVIFGWVYRVLWITMFTITAVALLAQVGPRAACMIDGDPSMTRNSEYSEHNNRPESWGLQYQPSHLHPVRSASTEH